MSDSKSIPIIGGVTAKPQRQALDLLFGNTDASPSSTGGIQKILVSELHDFPRHPFTVREDEAMESLIESIRENGILLPLLVHTAPSGGYEIISGHRRTYAARAIGLTEVPAIIEDITNEEAIIQMVDSNLQREQILPSEKARAYKMKLDAMKKQGKRTDLTSSPMATKLDSASELGKQAGESRDQVFRYIRLNNLIPPLLDMVDSGDLPLRAAVELSYCSKGWQEYELDMYQHDTKPTVSRAVDARQLSTDDKDGKKLAFMSAAIAEERQKKSQEQAAKADAELRGNLRKPRRITLQEDDISPYWSELIPAKQIKKEILTLLQCEPKGGNCSSTQPNLALAVVRDPNDEYEVTCPVCGTDLYGGPRTHHARTDADSSINFCWICGQRISWDNPITEQADSEV